MFIAEESGAFTYTFSNKVGYGQKSISYKKNDAASWTTTQWEAGKVVTVNVVAGDTVQWKAEAYNIAWNLLERNGSNSHFDSTARFHIQGSLEALAQSDNGDYYPFIELFAGCTTLTKVDNVILPRSRNALRTYKTDASVTDPELIRYVYEQDYQLNKTFMNCTALEEASFASALQGYRAYAECFSGCTALKKAYVFKGQTIWHESMYRRIFYNCSSLEEVDNLGQCNFVSDADDIYNGYGKSVGSQSNSSAGNAYREAFYGCAKLTEITLLGQAQEMGADRNNFYNWLNGTAVGTTGILRLEQGITRYPYTPSNWQIEYF